MTPPNTVKILEKDQLCRSNAPTATNQPISISTVRAKPFVAQRAGNRSSPRKELEVTGQHHTLTYFPVSSIVVLNYVTAGIFSLFYLNLLHDRMPKFRRTDPSSTVAICLCLVPVFKFVLGVFSVYIRLCVRINEQRRFAGLYETAPEWLAIPVGILFACGLSAAFFTTSVSLYIWGTLGIVVMPGIRRSRSKRHKRPMRAQYRIINRNRLI